MINKLLKRRVYVVPVGNMWGVFQTNAVRAFWRDLWSFGWAVATYNLWFTVTH